MGDNSVYLLVGQRGSGKSHYCHRLVEKQTGLFVISRDEILVRLFGSVHTNPYTGSAQYAQEIMRRLLRLKLSTQTGLKLILDTWTGNSRERRALLRELRTFGAVRVVALYFVTPLEVVQKWFWQKPGIAKISEMEEQQKNGCVFFSEDAPAHDYRMFHKLASDIDADGFDEVLRIDPRQAPIMLTTAE